MFWLLTSVDLKTNVFLIQEQKLRSELALVKGNFTVMSEMLNDLIPGQSKEDDTELLQVCVCVCVRIMDIVFAMYCVQSPFDPSCQHCLNSFS